MTSKLIQEAKKIPNVFIVNDHNASLEVDNYRMSIYDDGNLLGFKLEGNIDGHSIYIVGDTDNYSRYNPKYSGMYRDAEADAIHVASMLSQRKIRTMPITRKGLFRTRTDICVIIPDKNGNQISYQRVSVNTSNFRSTS